FLSITKRDTFDRIASHAKASLRDHASARVPTNLKQLGLRDHHLEDHIAYDIGTAALARSLSEALACEAILSNVSRLVIDKNRRLDQPGLAPDVSDGIAIPGNAGLSEDDMARRIQQYYAPYHTHIEAQVSARQTPMLISLHSFTPQMNGHQRPWHCGLLYNNDNRMARHAIAHFEGLGLCVGDNEPYPGNVFNATMDRHAEAHGHPYVMLEIRNDLLRSAADIALWTQRIEAFLAPHM
ncbi:MAG: N-formylglutamate amidohydrolase, partial [Pseudomonadota bacterium]